MSTRSYIFKENQDGTYTGIYCHFDGYLSHNGSILLNHYSNREKVEKLISKGNLSSLAPNIDPDPNKPHSFDEPQEGVCVFYRRDRGGKDEDAIVVRLKQLDRNHSIDYYYVFGLDNVWYYFNPGGLKYGLKKLPNVLKDRAEK